MYFRRRLTRGNPSSASRPSAHQFEVQFKSNGPKGGASPFHRRQSPNVMSMSGSAGEGEFDIGRHIQQNLMASR